MMLTIPIRHLTLHSELIPSEIQSRLATIILEGSRPRSPNSLRLLTNPHSLCSPTHPDYQADLKSLRQQQFQRSPAALSSPDYYWAPVNSQAWGFFRDDISFVIMRGNQLHDRLKAAFEEATLFDVEDRLKDIQVPTLVVGGRHDPIVPKEESIAVHERIPSSNLLVLEHSGHGAQGADETIFRDQALRFLSDLTKGT